MERRVYNIACVLNIAEITEININHRKFMEIGKKLNEFQVFSKLEEEIIEMWSSINRNFTKFNGEIILMYI